MVQGNWAEAVTEFLGRHELPCTIRERFVSEAVSPASGTSGDTTLQRLGAAAGAAALTLGLGGVSVYVDATGRVKEKVLPRPCSLSTQILPPCASTIILQ